ncbi:tripartite tricarboxylate transporter substrate binding protein [Azospirillum sp. SYSU D00513]|uniref:Bug family tripartite tricarboxylate transporter substrate binding protein n=1 Tax=Azospirillum sp. SYSU D00513 TaxID=2812561 RepID=UPI001A9614B0|nr:tripartite tricarboxylate transporter substrate binding protein [Azospirillum sp. SYSU D00513]
MKALTIASAVLAAGLFGAGQAGAQDAAATYPNTTVKIIVPYNAGGSTDTLGRLLAQELSERYKQSFVVENRAGAGGNVGTTALAQSAPDGYTLGMGTVATHAINPTLWGAKSPYKITDFAPISQVAVVPNILMVHPDVKANTIPELIELLKKSPGELNYASSGTGTSQHLATELFKTMSGTDMVHVPYKGSSESLKDFLGGRIQVMIDNSPSALPQVQAGRGRALGVATAQRMPELPDVPTIGEFLPGYEAVSWQAFYAPAGTPPAIVNKLSTAVREILTDPEVVERLKKAGVTPAGTTPEALAAHMEKEATKWAKVIKDSGAKIE